MKNILEICCEAADLAAVKRPDDLFDSSGQQNSVFLSVAKSELDSLMRYGDWPALVKDGCLYSSGGKIRYEIRDYIPDFYCLINNTVYLRKTNEKLSGAATAEKFSENRCRGGKPGFIIRNGGFVIMNKPCGRAEIVFQYRSNNIVRDGKTYEEKNVLSANTDVPLFDPYVVKLGILWRWLKRSGMDYGEEFAEYRRELRKCFGSFTAAGDINLSGGGASEGVKINVCTLK